MLSTDHCVGKTVELSTAHWNPHWMDDAVGKPLRKLVWQFGKNTFLPSDLAFVLLDIYTK